jgi:quercetin dioxygenase-like cupin family protein
MATVPADLLDRLPAAAPPDRPWSVPLLVTPEAETWLLGWPAGLVAPAHGHGRATVTVTVVAGALGEECLDPTIWTTARRTTWREGSTVEFPPGHVHLLGAAGGRPAVTVHAWRRAPGSAGGGAGRPGPVPGGPAGAGRPGGGGGLAQPVGLGAGACGHHRLAGQAADGRLDLVHVRDRVAG